MILTCTCKHDDQDRFYGKGRRVHNATAKKDYLCTVCGNRRGGSASTETAGKSPKKAKAKAKDRNKK